MSVVAGRLLTWSNALTLSRLVSAPVFFCALVGGASGLALVLFWVAVVTDMADGRLARARGETSNLGGLLDHATDASFVSLGLVALAQAGQVPVALPILVAAAFLQYMLDSKSLSGRALRASSVGRWNGILYFVPLGIVATRNGLGLDWPADPLILVVGWALVASTTISMADRAWTLLGSRREDADPS
ncbi:MAG: CDP-alcohol phosphatidyltransferase family protein [bacterium]|nr:CDP-alcohol phosphatidyltransferase family protein [bacterium]